MSAYGLNKLIGQACISDTFQAGLMNGRRAELIQLPEFNGYIEPDEASALLAIKADTFADFSAEVERLIQREGHPARADSRYVAAVRWPSAVTTGVYLRQQP